MSGIIVTVYDGDSTEYVDQLDNKGQVDEEQSSHYTDGEELDAATAILEHLRDSRHFDVRQWVN